MRQIRRRPRPRPARRRSARSRRAATRGRRRRAEGRDHRRRDARRDRRATATTPTRPTPRRSSTRSNVVKVYSPNATWSKVKARGRRRIGRHLLRPRQRLAQPVHVRPEVHDQGRLRPQRDRRRRRQQQQVLRRAVRLDARPRAERGRPAPPPLLRVGQLGAGQRAPTRQRRPPARRQLRRRLPQGRRRRRSSPTATPARALPPGPVHDPPDDRGHVADRAELPRPRELVRLDPDARRDRLHGPRQATSSGYYRSLVADPA